MLTDMLISGHQIAPDLAPRNSHTSYKSNPTQQYTCLSQQGLFTLIIQLEGLPKLYANVGTTSAKWPKKFSRLNMFLHLVSRMRLVNTSWSTGLLRHQRISKQVRWYWIPEQQPDEVLIIKFADTAAELDPSIARCCAHGSAVASGTEAEEARSSIECAFLRSGRLV